MSTNRLTDRPVRQSAAAAEDSPFRRTGPREAKPKVDRIKRTFHLDKDKVLLLEKLQVARFEQSGVKPELSSLVGEAIALLSAAGPVDSQTS